MCRRHAPPGGGTDPTAEGEALVILIFGPARYAGGATGEAVACYPPPQPGAVASGARSRVFAFGRHPDEKAPGCCTSTTAGD